MVTGDFKDQYAAMSMTQLSLALIAVEDWLREQPARHAGEMADAVNAAQGIIEGLADLETREVGAS